MQINNVEVDFKISRLKDAAAFEKALNNMAASEKKVSAKNGRKLSEVILDTINVFQNFFKDATGQDILADCGDLEVAKSCYMQFLTEIQVQKAAVLEPFDPDSIR